MDRAEAIKVLKHITINIKWDEEREEIYFTDKWVQAYEMAIAALREQDVTDINVGNKWISVKERLPEPEQLVWVQCVTKPNSFKYQCLAFYVPKKWLREASDFCWDYECCDEYDEEADDYYVNEGWYERIYNWDDYNAVSIGDFVTHWMPLPEPPKEGADPE